MLKIFLHLDADLLHLGIQHEESLINRLKVLSQTGVHRLELSLHRLQLTHDLLQCTQYCITGRRPLKGISY
jgi:hypothetical protein